MKITFSHYILWIYRTLVSVEFLLSVFLFWLQNLQVKMRGGGFPWSKLLMVLLVFAAGFIAHDIRSHGSFAGPSQSCTVYSSQSLVFMLSFEVLQWVCFRFHHSPASSQLRCHSRISAGLEQNNSLHQTGFQVWPYPQTFMFNSSHVYVKQALDHYILVVFSSDKLTKLPSTVCQILVELGLTLS